jgi:hypothetical protein
MKLDVDIHVVRVKALEFMTPLGLSGLSDNPIQHSDIFSGNKQP